MSAHCYHVSCTFGSLIYQHIFDGYNICPSAQQPNA